MKLKTPLKARMLLNKAFDDAENAKLAYQYLRDKYPHEFSKGMSVFSGGQNGEELDGGAKIVNLIFAPNL